MFGASKGIWESDEHYKKRMNTGVPLPPPAGPAVLTGEMPPIEQPLPPIEPPTDTPPVPPVPEPVSAEAVTAARETITRLAEAKDPRFEEIRAMAKELAKEVAEAAAEVPQPPPPVTPPAADVPDELDRSALGDAGGA